MPNSQNNQNPKSYIIYYLGNYIVYCICQYDKSELYANSAFKIVFFDGKRKRCSFTFMKIQWDPRLHKNIYTKNLQPFLQFPQCFCYFCLELRNQQNFFGPVKEQPSLWEIKIVWEYVQCVFGPLSSQQSLISSSKQLYMT